MKTTLHSKNMLFFLNEEPYNIIEELNKILDKVWKDIRKLINKKSLSEKQYYLVFDESNQDDKYSFKGNYGMIFPLKPIKKRKVPNLDPGENLKILEDKLKNHYDYFIWLSYGLYNSQEKDDNNKILLFWSLIHELYHLYQFLQYCPEIGDVNNFLTKAREWGKLDYQSPLEYNAEMKTIKILENEFGKKCIEDFCNCRMEKRFKEMFYINKIKSIDIEEKLVKIVRKNQKKLEEFQNNNMPDSKKFFSVNIICDTRKICNNNKLEI